jgi:hypothetical protein
MRGQLDLPGNPRREPIRCQRNEEGNVAVMVEPPQLGITCGKDLHFIFRLPNVMLESISSRMKEAEPATIAKVFHRGETRGEFSIKRTPYVTQRPSVMVLIIPIVAR